MRSGSRARRLRRYVQPRLLCIDEVGYLSYDSRYTDLLFEAATRRYDGPCSIVLSTNKPFADWSEVFPHAASPSQSAPKSAGDNHFSAPNFRGSKEPSIPHAVPLAFAEW